MTDNNHPITPPPELLQQWATEYWGNPGEPIGQGERYIAIEAARWGADQELEACCEWLDKEIGPIDSCDLRGDRRPKPISLKKKALQALENADGADHPVVATVLTSDQYALIRKALEQLDD
jgi:hypothetical protein